jgi:hypothetical protein
VIYLDKKILSKLLDLAKSLDERYMQIDEMFGGDSFLSKELSDLWKIIGDYVGIPSFYDDLLINLLYDFGQGDISKEETMKKLMQWNEYGKKVLK